ncbi:MAG: sulfotransferase family protein [archaeon]
MSKLYDIFNFISYAYKRNNWIFDLSRYIKDFQNVQVKKPIFFLGTHGGGLTLVSRMIRRNKKIVSVSGNYKYWSGADEMQVVLGSILPFELSGIKHHVPNFENYKFPFMKTEMTWLYATNELLKYYRKDEEDFTDKVSELFNNIIKWLIYRHSKGEQGIRFTDKSQVYTVKVSYINKLLTGSDPKFILITRNPYAMCYRAPYKEGGLKKILGNFSFEDKLELAAQHWANSINCALDDKEKVDNFLTIRFEDILTNPEKKLKEICDFIELDYNDDMIPQAHHNIPFGSRYFKKWYPLKPSINNKYFNNIQKSHIDIINKYCADLVDKFDYNYK